MDSYHLQILLERIRRLKEIHKMCKKSSNSLMERAYYNGLETALAILEGRTSKYL